MVSLLPSSILSSSGLSMIHLCLGHLVAPDYPWYKVPGHCLSYSASVYQALYSLAQPVSVTSHGARPIILIITFHKAEVPKSWEPGLDHVVKMGLGVFAGRNKNYIFQSYQHTHGLQMLCHIVPHFWASGHWLLSEFPPLCPMLLHGRPSGASKVCLYVCLMHQPSGQTFLSWSQHLAYHSNFSINCCKDAWMTDMLSPPLMLSFWKRVHNKHLCLLRCTLK